jgi:beta-glucosidase
MMLKVFSPAVDGKVLAHLAASQHVSRNDFGPAFEWGVATSAFQIEGAIGADGRGVSIWDSFCNVPGNIADGSTGEVACDHYHRYEQDLDLIASLGATAYRFSIAWPRVQPQGKGAWNEAGFAFYERLLDGLERRGIRAHLTLNHWDLPQALQDEGGWANRATVRHFCDYAREVGRRFGHRVASLVTHNEPWVIAALGHETGVFAPGIKDRAVAMQVAHHLLLSHGLALQALRADGVPAPLGIVLNLSSYYAATDSAADMRRAVIEDGLITRWYLEPLLIGKYPADILQYLGKDAPQAEPGDMESIRQPLDFLGINYYMRWVISAERQWLGQEHGRPVTDMGWEIYPQGLTELLLRLNSEYKLPPVYITENGAAFKDTLENGAVHDPERVSYLQEHIAAVALARRQGVDVRGYFAWSLLDNFEWSSGYAKRFGIVHVNYATQQRTPKSSARWYAEFLRGG